MTQKNLLAMIFKNNDFYELGTEHGLSKFYTRNEFSLCRESYIKSEEVPATKIFLQECMRKSLFEGQGFKRCNCKGKCSFNKFFRYWQK